MKRLIVLLVFIYLLYIPACANIDYQDALEYFKEIALKSEYGGEGSEGIIKKWEQPLKIYIMGNFTKKDYDFIKKHVTFLNNIEGIPDISFVDDINIANVTIDFITQWEISRRVNIEEIIWGYARCFWNDNYEITGADIFVVYDKTNQRQRKHVILEELTQILGLMNDSIKYRNSIFQNEYSEITRLSSLDTLLIRMLYSSGVKPGMRGDEINDIINNWYSFYCKKES